MAKRRTKKQKASAKHQFAVSWKSTQSPSDIQVVRRQRLSRRQPSKSEAKTTATEAIVKGQFLQPRKRKKSKSTKGKIPEVTAKLGDLASVKPDIIKSLLLASLILCLEIMIYLGWPK